MNSTAPTPDQLLDKLTGSWVSQALYVAAKLGIADQLTAGPRSDQELAESVGADPRSLRRILRALAGQGVFFETGDSKWLLTPLAQMLRSDVPGSLRAMAILLGEEHAKAWCEVLGSVKTGKTAFDTLYGERFFDHIGKDSEKNATFNAAMTGWSTMTHTAVAEAYDFSGIKVLMDVGGGHGTLLCAILKRHPHLKGILFDLPHVVGGARACFESEGLAERCEVREGNFFEGVPPGADAHILSTVIHDWEDEKAIAILQNCRAVAPAGGKLLLCELVIPRGNDPHFGKLLDLNMLVMTGGRERTEQEYAALYEKAGYRLTRVVPTRSPVSVVEGEAV